MIAPITQDGVMVRVGQIWRYLGNDRGKAKDMRVWEVRGVFAHLLPRGDERGLVKDRDEPLVVPIRDMHKHLTAEWKLTGWELTEIPNERGV